MFEQNSFPKIMIIDESLSRIFGRMSATRPEEISSRFQPVLKLLMNEARAPAVGVAWRASVLAAEILLEQPTKDSPAWLLREIRRNLDDPD